jgi:hypothetical protein
MATFRFKILIGLAAASLACAGSAPGDADTSNQAAPALIAQQVIEHVSPKRDAVGPTPSRFEWSPVDGADSYTFSLHNEIGLVATSENLPAPALDWPAENRLSPGTYFWIVTAIRDRRAVAGSGRSAFVVVD